MKTAVLAFRMAAALACLVSALILLFQWGLNLKFWSIIGAAAIIVALVSAYYFARRDYIGAATPSALAALVVLFVALPSGGWLLLAVALLFAASTMGFALYEVD
ncbi:MAG: hypothetical protein ACUVV6_04450 [Thermoplasmatota archaeon]